MPRPKTLAELAPTPDADAVRRLLALLVPPESPPAAADQNAA